MQSSKQQAMIKQRTHIIANRFSIREEGIIRGFVLRNAVSNKIVGNSLPLWMELPKCLVISCHFKES
jgi:hypothetical protein